MALRGTEKNIRTNTNAHTSISSTMIGLRLPVQKCLLSPPHRFGGLRRHDVLDRSYQGEGVHVLLLVVFAGGARARTCAHHFVRTFVWLRI